MPFARWFAVARPFDETLWHDAVVAHRQWERRLEELEAPVVIGTRPTERDDRRYNEAFIATSDGVIGFHDKRYLPDEDGYWEASWFCRGDGAFEPVKALDALVGVQICTELWTLCVSREYGREGVDVIAVPRATPATSRERWVVGGRAAAIVSGAYCISSNRAGASTSGDPFAGHGWIIEPDGEVLGLTSDSEPVITRDVDLVRARNAKATYPRYVR
jgi:N-carbamoylputrescine amidase